MRPAHSWLLLAAGLALAGSISACGTQGATATPPTISSAATQQPTPTSLASPVTSPSPGPSANTEAQAAAVDAAVRDAAGRLSLAIGAGDLHVQQVEAHEWPDSSLGCPRQGVMYAQIVTPGFLVVVSAAGKELEYHTDSRGRIVLCQGL
jgi:hypothetical protein